MGMTVKEMITMTEGLTRNEVGFPLKKKKKILIETLHRFDRSTAESLWRR